MQSRLASCLLVVVMTGFMPTLVRGQPPEPKKDPAAKEKQPANSEFLDSRSFELLIVGPDGKPVPKAEFEIRMSPAPKEWIFHRGEASSKPHRYGKLAVADESGAATFEFPAVGLKSLVVNVTTPGFGPFWASWQPDENTAVIPDRYTVHLDAGVSVGGITVDDQGRPVAGVTINPSLEFKKREGDFSQLGVGTRIKSDENGKWVYHSVPATLESLRVGLDHPEYMGGTYVQLPLKDYTVARGAEPSKTLVVPRGETVKGKVTSADGKPIAGAQVRAKFVNSQREAVTDENGSYRLKGCQPGPGYVFATAKGFGPQMAQPQIGPDLGAVDFQLPPGRTIRVRAVDAQGRPIPKFRVFFRRWKIEDYGYGLGLQLAYANENGVWEWNEAPDDPIIADICPPDLMQLSDQSLVARAEEYVFKFTDQMAPLTVFGAVSDKVTGRPIPEFRVVPGTVSGDRIHWSRSETFDGKDGKFYFRSNYPRGSFRFRVEANGYLTSDSDPVAERGRNSNVQVQLLPGEGVNSAVLLPTGEPAAGATVVIGVARTSMSFTDGEFNGHSSSADRRTTDPAGKFSFPSQVGPFEVVAVHPFGFAWITGVPGEPVKPMTLTAWARVQGVLNVGRQPGPGIALDLSLNRDRFGEDGPSVHWNYSTTTGKDGTFGWNRVLPGEGTISRNVRHHVTSRTSRSNWSHSPRVMLRAGEVTKINLGGNGRAVIGKLQAPADLKGPVDWNFGTIQLTGQKPREIYCSAIQLNGSFRIDDVPPGQYKLKVDLDAPTQELVADGPTIAILEQDLIVVAAGGPASDEAMDVGMLILKGAGK
ncbi:hypothetical protein AYO47_03595 [Planctomyces sp. SCGC AG-212-M04]|nr:hypothetical protein AYO47_03595 [Planctomyces sp. SCGC AG-212-M04]